jgi:hypothetical protein
LTSKKSSAGTKKRWNYILEAVEEEVAAEEGAAIVKDGNGSGNTGATEATERCRVVRQGSNSLALSRFTCPRSQEAFISLLKASVDADSSLALKKL